MKPQRLATVIPITRRKRAKRPPTPSQKFLIAIDIKTSPWMIARLPAVDDATTNSTLVELAENYGWTILRTSEPCLLSGWISDEALRRFILERAEALTKNAVSLMSVDAVRLALQSARVTRMDVLPQD